MKTERFYVKMLRAVLVGGRPRRVGETVDVDARTQSELVAMGAALIPAHVEEDETCESSMELAAHVAHEVNRAYCLSLGDASQMCWDEAPDWQKSSAIAGARAILLDPSTSPEQSHEGWMKQKLTDGWKYGPEKNPESKEHPCICEYDQLPADQRTKDYLFGAAVRAVLGLPASGNQKAQKGV